MDAIEAVYEGQITIKSAACQTAATVQSWGLSPDGNVVRATLTVYRSASGDQEMYTCRQGQTENFRILSEPDDIAIVTGGGQHVTLMPHDAVVSLGYLGILLPEDVSRLVVRVPKKSEPVEDVCGGREGCVVRSLDRASGTHDTVAVTDSGRSYLKTVAKRPQARWELQGSSGGYPQNISFWSYNYDGSVMAEARWVLKGWKAVPNQELRRDSFISAGASEVIMKDGTGLGGKYDPGRKDTWKFYRDQLAMHGVPKEPAHPPYAAIGLSILVVCLVAVATWIRLGTRWKGAAQR